MNCGSLFPANPNLLYLQHRLQTVPSCYLTKVNNSCNRTQCPHLLHRQVESQPFSVCNFMIYKHTEATTPKLESPSVTASRFAEEPVHSSAYALCLYQKMGGSVRNSQLSILHMDHIVTTLPEHFFRRAIQSINTIKNSSLLFKYQKLIS